ncbi:hypothetical protein FisN_17Hh251 [Fistulifera solaris]|uniref:Uncharacterized protein n=1 Tax=Fistulifera solaris TaxID=1519565 RepID=A0A1Z5JH34_FISSO|nr:hypothetical protein FisN_17Hh251 [Fistulifera solaris]|eukprot:GAX13310.1 hypothetical protein FisN_17Hh251 [Fistulifera solaris]
MDFPNIKGKRRRSAEDQLFESPDATLLKRPKQPSVPPTPSTSDSRKSLLFEAAASSKSFESKDKNSRSSGRRRSLSNKEGGSSVSQSRLFQNEATESTFETATLLPSSQETREALSHPFQSPEKGINHNNAAKGRSSFFGAVMSNVQQWKSGEPSTVPSTPQTSELIHNKTAPSPGGFNLMNFVKSVTSPFEVNQRAPSTPMTPKTPMTPRYGSSTPRHEREWHQATLSFSGQVKWIDWTLKSKLEFECSPGHSLHHCTSSTRQKALVQFIAPMSQSPTTNSQHDNTQHQLEDASMQWQQGLFYWQYPVALPDQASSRDDTVHSRKSANASTSSLSRMGFSRSNSMPALAFTKGAQSKTSGADLHSAREKEWQESFTSLYTSWIERVKMQCEKQMENDDAFAEEVAATYFYAQRKEHTVLFKVGISSESSKLVKAELVPEIIISSITPEQREKLRPLGVTWRMLERYSRKNNTFDEQPTQSAGKENQGKDDTACDLDEDLVALRLAQVCGKTAGADVSISATSRKLSPTPKFISPLFVSGFADCEKFYDVYHRTCGKFFFNDTIKKDPKINPSKANGLSPELPLLLCRKLGPFLNASLKQLEVHYSNLEAEHSPGAYYDAAEVSGILLPCAVRSLIHAASQSIEFTQRSPVNTDTSRDSSESIVGTNHMIVKLSLHRNLDDRKESRKEGMPNSSLFNADTFLWDTMSEKESYEVCHFRESVETAVWDVNRPKDVAYKLKTEQTWDLT